MKKHNDLLSERTQNSDTLQRISLCVDGNIKKNVHYFYNKHLINAFPISVLKKSADFTIYLDLSWNNRQRSVLFFSLEFPLSFF